MKKINVFINLIKNISTKHIDAQRLNVSDFYICLIDVFTIFDFFYLNKNCFRDTRRKFDVFQIKLDQFFSVFYFDFILLVNQLTNYSKKTKMNSLKKKIIEQLQRIIAFSEKFETLKNFKDYFQIVDTRLSNIRFEIFFKTDSKSRYITKRIIVTIIDTILLNRLVISKNIRIVFNIERKTF